MAQGQDTITYVHLTAILTGAAVLTQLCLDLTQTGYLDPSSEGLGPSPVLWFGVQDWQTY